MIERYTLPEMGGIWTEDAKFQSWLDVEVAVCEAQSELGRVPTEALATIKDKAAFSRERILEICLLYTSPSPRDRQKSRMPSSA